MAAAAFLCAELCVHLQRSMLHTKNIYLPNKSQKRINLYILLLFLVYYFCMIMAVVSTQSVEKHI